MVEKEDKLLFSFAKQQSDELAEQALCSPAASDE